MVASLPTDPRRLRLRLGEVTYALEDDKHVIGRSRSCDIRLREDSVSRLHAAFVWRDGALVLEDLGSSNGTYLNGVRVAGPREVADGDDVRFGALRATIERSDAPPPKSAAMPGTGTGSGLTARIAAGSPAGFWRRALAALADTALFTVGSSIPFAPLLATLGAERFLLAPDAIPPGPQTRLVLAGACTALWLVYAGYYFLHGWARRGCTPGMRMCGLRLLDWRQRVPVGYGRALLRMAAGIVTLLTLGLGFLLVAFRRDHKALHDLLAGTTVVRLARPLGSGPTPA